MRALSDSISDISDTDMDEEENRARELGAAAPAADDDKRYLEREKERRERAKSKAKEREEKRKRVEEQEFQRTEDDVDVREMLSGAREMLPDDFHKVLLIQDSEIRQLKQDREESKKAHRMQAETNSILEGHHSTGICPEEERRGICPLLLRAHRSPQR